MLILVVEDSDVERQLLPPRAMYRLLGLRGRTYNEKQYRRWVEDSFDGDRDDPLGDLAALAKAGGWATFILVDGSEDSDG